VLLGAMASVRHVSTGALKQGLAVFGARAMVDAHDQFSALDGLSD